MRRKICDRLLVLGQHLSGNVVKLVLEHGQTCAMTVSNQNGYVSDNTSTLCMSLVFVVFIEIAMVDYNRSVCVCVCVCVCLGISTVEMSNQNQRQSSWCQCGGDRVDM